MDELENLGEQLEPKTMFEWNLGSILVCLLDYFDDPDSFTQDELDIHLDAADELTTQWKEKYAEEIQVIVERHG